MRRNTPLITLLTGAALGVILLAASMLATPSGKPASYSAAAAAATSAPATSAPGPATSAPATSPAPSSPSPAAASPAAPSPTTVTTSPVKATYAGRVGGGGGSVAVSIHGSQAIAYVCNGSTVEAWFKGTAVNGVLIMTGKNHSHFSAIYDFGKVTGDVLAHGTDYSFSVPVVSKPSGLYRATAVVRGATIKAGWIVLSDGTQVGALEPDADSPEPPATEAPALDVATGTAQAGNLTLHAVAVDGVTGSGF
jgi:serine/threonine-protein kinase